MGYKNKMKNKMKNKTIPANDDHSDLARFLNEACALRFVANFTAEKGVEVLQEGEVTSGVAVDLGGAINVYKNVEESIDHIMSVFLKEGHGLDKDEVLILVDKIMESMRTDGFDVLMFAYEKWMKQTPQLVKKYLKGY